MVVVVVVLGLVLVRDPTENLEWIKASNVKRALAFYSKASHAHFLFFIIFIMPSIEQETYSLSVSSLLSLSLCVCGSHFLPCFFSFIFIFFGTDNAFWSPIHLHPIFFFFFSPFVENTTLTIYFLFLVVAVEMNETWHTLNREKNTRQWHTAEQRNSGLEEITTALHALTLCKKDKKN